MADKRVSFNIDEELAFEIKKKAVEERTTQKKLLESWIKAGLGISE